MINRVIPKDITNKCIPNVPHCYTEMFYTRNK